MLCMKPLRERLKSSRLRLVVRTCFRTTGGHWGILSPRTHGGYSLMLLNRIALAITLTDDSEMAAAAMTGDSKMPNLG